jgi:hypothetical protein
MMLTGDVNLMDVTAPDVPFRLVAPILKRSDFVFSNLECCFYRPPGGRAVENAGFIADPVAGEALTLAGIQAVGVANNVNYGEAAIKSSLARLDELGIPHTGAGENRDTARAPVILERGLGSFSFHTGAHGGVAVEDWVGMLAKISLEDRAVAGATFEFVRHNKINETVPCALLNEQAAFEDIAKCSAKFGTKLKAQDDQVLIELNADAHSEALKAARLSDKVERV